MTLKAIKMFDYDQRRLQAGQVFEPASDADGHVLVLAQLAVDLRAEDDE
jgi:hypothetical protein